MGMGMFSLMSNGCDGAKKEETAGTRPVNLDAWSRYYLGWEMPNAAKADSQAKSLDIYCQNYTKASGPIKVNSPASLPYQYYLMEVRDATDTSAWDAGLQTFMGTAGTNGVLMLHVDETIGAGSLEEDNDFNQHGVSEESKDKVLQSPSGRDARLSLRRFPAQGRRSRQAGVAVVRGQQSRQGKGNIPFVSSGISQELFLLKSRCR